MNLAPERAAVAAGVSAHRRLAADKLRKAYRGRVVVNDVSLDVEPGEVVGLLGPNGAGKTTTFYMVVGLTPPDAGRVFLGDDDITELPMYLRAQRGISYLPQEPSVFRKMSVEDNLRSIFETLDLSHAEQERRIAQLIQEFGLSKVRKSPGYALSGGEPRRDRPRPGHRPLVYPSGRAVRGHRPDRGARYPRDHPAAQVDGDRRPHHRPQRARDAEDHRPRVYHQQRRDLASGNPSGALQRSSGA
jgi:hypothetical protein